MNRFYSIRQQTDRLAGRRQAGWRADGQATACLKEID